VYWSVSQIPAEVRYVSANNWDLIITNITRNTSDCDQSNVYSLCIILSSISPNLHFRSFSSLHHRSASYPPLGNKCPICYYMRQVIIESEGKVWSVYIYKVNRIMRFSDMAVWIFQNGCRPPSWIWSNWKWRRSIRRPENPMHLEQTWRGSDDALQSYGHLKFSKMCKWALRSVVVGWSSVGRSSIFILLTLIS